MKRRRFLSSMGIILPAAIISSEVIFSSCNPEVKNEYFSEENIKLLDEIGETIIPATSASPGAKAAMIGAFMKVYVTDCYTPEQQNIFWEAIKKVNEIGKNKYNTRFPKLTLAQKRDVLYTLQHEPQAYQKNSGGSESNGDAVQTGKGQPSSINNNDAHFYPMIKELVLFGFFTSKPGATKALRYIQTPGSYQGDVPYNKGDKAWAT